MAKKQRMETMRLCLLAAALTLFVTTPSFAEREERFTPRQEMSKNEFLKSLTLKELTFFVTTATRRIEQLTNDPETQRVLARGLKELIARREDGEDVRFPVLPPLHKIAKFQGLIGGNEGPAPKPGVVVTGDFVEMLSKAKTTYSASDPTPINKDLPEIKYGHFADRRLSLTQIAQSQLVAQLLTSLAAANGSKVEWKHEEKVHEIQTPVDFFKTLLASGHQIEVSNERTYANFIAIVRGEKYVRWAAWIDTGIKMNDGKNLMVPMSHSQHTWKVSGPLVNARVAFFLGIGGVGFFPQIDERPQWTALATRDVVTSGKVKSDAHILATVDVASRYFTRIRQEATTGPAKGMKGDGYGLVGICNDSNAVIEYATRGTQSTYPWVRSPSLQSPDSPEFLDKIFTTLKPDTQLRDEDLGEGELVREKVLCRILAGTPHPLDSPVILDKLLAAQLKEAETSVKTVCKNRVER